MNDNYLYEFFIDDVKRLLNTGSDIEALTVTENGTYSAPEGVDGYNPVTVNVASSGSIPSVSSKAVNFYDYDGTCLYAYTVEEAQALTEMPPLPERKGLICQGWNWSLEDIKVHNRAVNVGATYITDDGITRIYITLQEGRTSPMLGVCPNGTVTVDWGDSTTPDVLTGTSTSTVKWTPNHEYAKPGDYVITLTVDGSVGFAGSSSTNELSYLLRHSSNADIRNQAYQSTVQKIEMGSGVTSIGSYAFNNCYSLASIVIPDGVPWIGKSAFSTCYSLASIVIPDSVTTIGDYVFLNCYSLASIVIPDGAIIGSHAFENCSSLASIVIPDSVTSIGSHAFYNCYSLASIVIPDSVTIIGSYAFYNCYSLASIVIPDSVTIIGSYAFYNCYSLVSIVIPDGVTSIGSGAFQYCYSLTSIVIPDGVTSIGNSAFSSFYGIRYFDFTKHTAVPALSNTNAFQNIPPDCEIRVPAALYDEWIAATNWATYASYIKAV